MATGSWLSLHDAIDAEVDRERVALLFRRAPVALATVLVNSVILAWFLSAQLPVVWLVAWVVALWGITALRGALFAHYLTRAHARPTPTWEAGYLAGAMANGVGWGVGTAWFLEADPIYALAALFVAGGMIMGASSSSATSMRSYVAYVVPAAAPAIVRLVTWGDATYLVMGLTALLFCVAVSLMANQGGGVVLDAIRLRLQNAALGRELSRRTKDRAWRLQRLLDYAGVTTIVADPASSRVLDASQNVERVLGVAHDGLLQSRLIGASSFPPVATRAAWRETVRASRAPGGTTLWLDHDDKQLEVSATVQDLGSREYLLVVIRDVTRERQLQNEVEESRRLASIGQASREMAHRVNNPLSYVLTSLDAAIAQMPLLDASVIAQLDRPLREARDGAQQIRETVAEHLATGSTRAAPALPFTQETPRWGRVLVIDDEPRVARSLARSLAGHRVEIETEPSRALDRILAYPGFDVVVCDVMMPHTSGMDLHRDLSEQAPHLLERIVFVTAGAYTAEAEAFLATLTTPYLIKPVAKEQLERAVQAMLRG